MVDRCVLREVFIRVTQLTKPSVAVVFVVVHTLIVVVSIAST